MATNHDVAAAGSEPFGVSNVTRVVSSLATDNAALLQATDPATGVVVTAIGARRLYMVKAYNAAASVRYLKLYDKATAPLSTDIPKITFAMRPSLDFDPNIPDCGITFRLGMGIRITNLPADNDATAPTLADIVGLNIGWQ